MQNSDVFALQRSGLNDFLFASVGTEPNGTTLSLLSVFARLGTDPWGEAGRLAGLPAPEAITSLARTLSGMPTSVWALPDATTIATRLIALLPTRAHGAAPTPSGGTLSAAQYLRLVLMLAAFAFSTAYMLGLFAGRDAPAFVAGRDGSAVTSAAPAAAPSATRGVVR